MLLDTCLSGFVLVCFVFLSLFLNKSIQRAGDVSVKREGSPEEVHPFPAQPGPACSPREPIPYHFKVGKNGFGCAWYILCCPLIKSVAVIVICSFEGSREGPRAGRADSEVGLGCPPVGQARDRLTGRWIGHSPTGTTFPWRGKTCPGGSTSLCSRPSCHTLFYRSYKVESVPPSCPRTMPSLIMRHPLPFPHQ